MTTTTTIMSTQDPVNGPDNKSWPPGTYLIEGKSIDLFQKKKKKKKKKGKMNEALTSSFLYRAQSIKSNR